MKKILFTANSLEIGGLERALVNLLNALADKYDITLILEKNKGLLKNELDKRIVIQEYKVYSDGFFLFRKIKNFTKRFIWTINNRNKYDFSCSYATYSIIGSKLALIASKNNSLYVHSDYYGVYNGDANEIKKFFESLSYRNFKNIIFVSNEGFDKVKDILEIKNKIVINNLVDYKKIKKLAKENVDESFFSSNKINIMYVGRFDNTSKNLDLLLDSFNLVDKGAFNLILLGDGYYKNKLIKKIHQLNLSKNVCLIPETNNPYPYINRCDVLVMTSKYEGFPLIYTEALVLNKPFFTTVNTSDGFINIKDYFYIVRDAKEEIACEINNYKESKINYKVDFLKWNEFNFNCFVNLIEKR